MSGKLKGHEVGYGRPPAASQFAPGKSGNPRGRAKGSRNVATLVEQELARNVDITVDGEHRRVSKGKVVARRVVDGAVKGDPKSIATVMNIQSGPLSRRSGPVENQAGPAREVTAEQDMAIIDAYFARSRSGDAKS